MARSKKSSFHVFMASLVVAGCGAHQPEPQVVPPSKEPPPPAAPEDAELSAAIENILGPGAQPQPGPAPNNAKPPTTPTEPTTQTTTTPSSAGQWRPGLFIMQSLERLAKVTMTAQTDYSLGFVGGGSAIFGAYLEPRTPSVVTREFEGGKSYVVVGSTDDDAHDLDVVIKDSGGDVVARDVENDAEPVVVFNPSTGGAYRVELYSHGPAFAAMAVMEKDAGFNVPLKRVQDSVYGSVQKAEELHQALLEKSNNQLGLAFHKGGDWCLLSTVLRQNQVVSQWFSLDGPHVFLASADEGGKDLDLALLNESDQKVAEDAEPDAVPFFSHRVAAGGYRLDLSVPAADDLTLATMVVLTVEEAQ